MRYKVKINWWRWTIIKADQVDVKYAGCLFFYSEAGEIIKRFYPNGWLSFKSLAR